MYGLTGVWHPVGEPRDGKERRPMDNWTFLTNYGHVLLCIAADPEIRMKDVAEKVGITERATQRIVADLLSEGYLSSEKKGRRNFYYVNSALPLRHPVERHNAIGQLLLLVEGPRLREAPKSRAGAGVSKSAGRAARGAK